MLRRLQRKLADVLKYPALAADPASRRDLLALALWRNRLLGASTTTRLTARKNPFLTPRLKATRGEPVAIAIGDWSEMDCFDELFVESIYALDAVPFAPDLVVDCGAFHGYFSALAVGYFPTARIVCFEPNPENQVRLADQLRLLSRPVESIAAAVGISDGHVEFSGHGMGGAVQESSSGSPDSHRVPLMDFPRWLTARQPRHLVWKLDIEGAEASLLPAALPCLPINTALFLETHYPMEKCETLLAPYRAAGFRTTLVRERTDSGCVYIEWLLLRQAP